MEHSGDLVGFEQYSDVCETQIQAIGNSFYFGVDLVVFGVVGRLLDNLVGSE